MSLKLFLFSVVAWLAVACVPASGEPEAHATPDDDDCCERAAQDAGSSSSREADAEVAPPRKVSNRRDAGGDVTKPAQTCGRSSEITQLCVNVGAAELKRLHSDPYAQIEVPAEVILAGKRYREAELEVHGGFSRKFKKLSYRIKFDDASETLTDFFGEGAEPTKRIVLQASWIDPTWSRAKLAMDLTREAGGLAPRIGHVELVLNGRYHGLYLAIERIDKHYLARAGLSKDADLFKAQSNWANWQVHKKPMKGFSRATNREKEDNHLGAFFKTLRGTKTTLEAMGSRVAPILDLNEFEIWNAVMTFADNQDTFSKNYYLYHDPEAEPGTMEALWRLIQWDADATFGNDWDGSRLRLNSNRYLGEKNSFAVRYFSVPEIHDAYVQRYSRWLAGLFKPSKLTKAVGRLESRLRKPIARDVERWYRDFSQEDEFARLTEAVRSRHEVMSELIRELAPAVQADGQDDDGASKNDPEN